MPANPCLAPRISLKSDLVASLINPTSDLFITAVGPPDCPITALPCGIF